MELLRILQMRCMALLRVVDERAVGDLRRRLGPQHGIVPQLGRDVRRGPLLADGGVVLVADDEQGAGLDEAERVRDGLRQHHVDDARLVDEEVVALAAVVDVVGHGHPLVVGGVPVADVVGCLLVRLYRVPGRGVLGLPVVLQAWVWDANTQPVFQAHWVDENQLGHVLVRLCVVGSQSKGLPQ